MKDREGGGKGGGWAGSGRNEEPAELGRTVSAVLFP